ncbi:hypothetical protein [Oscillibacter sp.]|uniref:hypothetical protein n=1 Tax=Oscillibacter sp. TaxID=1945593 RepID=UPI00289FFD8B|nr:hypothetical protein [Oscillibacter sp.]
MGECILAGHPQGGGVKCGTYTGDGQTTRTISLGVTPKWVLVVCNDKTIGRGFFAGGLAITGSPQYYHQGAIYQVYLQIVDVGFAVANSEYVRTNLYGFEYNYIYGT